MSNTTVGAHVVALLLALLQCGLATVLAYRSYLLSCTHKGVDPHRRPTAVNMLRVHRVCVFVMTTLQCVRCIDPFCALGIWPYAFTRSVQLIVTITLYFQYSATTYVCMDTLYACALKRTPCWLAIVVSILPVAELGVGAGGLFAQFASAQQWITAVVDFYIVLALAVNLTTYNVSGFWLIRILRTHQLTGAGEDITGSKSASPYDAVIAKTLRSMFLMSLPSLAALLVLLILGIGNCNNRPIAPYNVNALDWSVFMAIFIQLVLGFLFTRSGWITKTALDAAIMASVNASSKESEKKSGVSSRAELKERAARLSQAPTKSRSETPPQNSQAESEGPVVVVTVDDSTPDVELC